MQTLPIAAGVGADGLIWIIIAVVYGIAQLVQRSRAAKRPPGAPPSSPPPPRSAMEREMRRILAEMSGQPVPNEELEEEDVEEFEPEEAPKPPPVVHRAPQPQRPAHRPLPQRAAPAASPVVARQPLASLREIAPPIEEVSLPAAVSFSQMLHVPGMSQRIKGIEYRGMRLSMTASSHTRHGRPVLQLQEMQDPATLRKFVLTRMVLEPPKALERPGGSVSGI